MLITRAQLSNFFSASLLSICPPEEQLITKCTVARYRNPPEGVSYDSNPTVFGQILDGHLDCCEISETDDLFTFHDRCPRAPLHALVIPKRFIPSVYDLDPRHDLELVEEMKRCALEAIKVEQPKSYEDNDFILCFHVPPFTSVGHLHLHVLAPASKMKYQYRYGKYLEGSMWCTSLNTVLDSLVKGGIA